ncbi:MAG: hypothetical protein U9Q62_01525 [Campylobacterota bacterium]|nr:hypothetical protein [Campylobacterota bacterium]
MLAVTVSIGIGEYKPGVEKELFIELVDGVLYNAKESGRNRIAEVDS